LVSVAPHVLRTIVHHWCASARLVHEAQFVVGRMPPPELSIGTLAGLAPGERCDVAVKLQPSALSESRTAHTSGESPAALTSRVERIAAIREWQRVELRKRARELTNAWLILVDVDRDIRALPPAGALRNTLQRAQAGGWSLLCANGVEPSLSQDRLTTYDTFPFVGTDGFWYYKDREAGRRQFDKITWSGDVYPVSSCFGGLAIYPFAVWAEPQCSYNESIDALHARGWLRFANVQDASKLLSELRMQPLCEHLRLNLCLKATVQTTEWQAGIESQLLLIRAHSRAAAPHQQRRRRTRAAAQLGRRG